MMTRMLQVAMLGLGLIAGGAVASMPHASMELLFSYLALPSVLSFATSPIGAAGRTVLALVAMLPFGVLAWLIGGGTVRLPVRQRARSTALLEDASDAAPVTMPAAAVAKMPTLRRADAHPDNPARWPIRASEDLGPPLPLVASADSCGVADPEQPLPVDLDQPIASFDPAAIPYAPRMPVRAVAALVPTPPLTPTLTGMRPLSVVNDDWAREAPAMQAAAILPAAVELEVKVAADVERGAVDARPLSVVHHAWAAYVPDAAEAVADVAEPMGVAEEDGEPAAPELDAEPAGGADATEAPRAEVASIAALLDRLERGAKRKMPAVVEDDPETVSLDDTLVMLRRLAAQ